jgi:hypothetical protein
MGFSAEGHQSYGRPLDRYRFAEPIAQRAYFVRENVGLGSKAALTAPKSDFSFTPESGLRSDIAPCPKGAISGSDQPQSALVVRAIDW